MRSCFGGRREEAQCLHRLSLSISYDREKEGWGERERGRRDRSGEERSHRRDGTTGGGG